MRITKQQVLISLLLLLHLLYQQLWTPWLPEYKCLSYFIILPSRLLPPTTTLHHCYVTLRHNLQPITCTILFCRNISTNSKARGVFKGCFVTPSTEFKTNDRIQLFHIFNQCEESFSFVIVVTLCNFQNNSFVTKSRNTSYKP